MSLALLNRQPITWDSEAASYLTAVESADSQSLEPAVARAINTFAIDCKIRGIWGAIKSSCLLCGARTLNGALVPLKGVAPTNNNFVSNDYNRETGLKGNGSTKYLDSNRAGTSDPSDNSHCSVYVSSPGTGATAYIGQNGFTTGASSIGTDTGSNNYLFLSLKTSNGSLSGLATIVGVTSAVGLMGMSKNNNNNFNYRFNSKTGIANIAATTVGSGNWEIFGRGGASRLPTNARLSFYSIGESLDLRLLEQCVERFNSSLRNVLYPTSINAEALNWIRLSEGYNNVKISATTAKALSDFCNSIESANLRNKFYRLNLFCGPTLGTALIPLYRGPNSSGTQYGNFFETSFNFTDSSYSELGLLGSSTSYLEPGLLTSTINSLYPSVHFTVYGNNIPTPNTAPFISTGDGSLTYNLVGVWTSTQWLYLVSGSFSTAAIFENVDNSRFGMKILSRTNDSLVRLYSNGSYVSQSTGTISSPPSVVGFPLQTIRLFASRIQNNPAGTCINLRSCGYSMGAGMTDSEASTYYTIMQTFQTALGRQV